MPTKKAMRSFLQALARYDRSLGQRGLAALLLKQGSWFHDRANSEEYEVPKVWKEKHRPRARECYFNAQKFCLDHAEGQYFEGYVLLEGSLPAEHAWVVVLDTDRKVIDFTFEAMEKTAKRQGLPCDTRGALYLGIGVPREFVEAVLRDEPAGPVAERFYGIGGE